MPACGLLLVVVAGAVAATVAGTGAEDTAAAEAVAVAGAGAAAGAATGAAAAMVGGALAEAARVAVAVMRGEETAEEGRANGVREGEDGIEAVQEAMSARAAGEGGCGELGDT